MIDVVIATRNSHKVRELVALIKAPNIRWHAFTEFPNVPPVRENGRTFRANAVKKAVAVARATGHFALADDSGLEVDALQGRPGVWSARFAGQHGDDLANLRKVLKLLEGVPASKRRATFRCVLALANPARLVGVTEGSVVGRIAKEPKGRRGFGYDPIFLVPRFGKTVAQLPASVKNRISHRARAARALRPLLARLTAGAAAVAGGLTRAARRRRPAPSGRAFGRG